MKGMTFKAFPLMGTWLFGAVLLLSILPILPSFPSSFTWERILFLAKFYFALT